MKKSQKSALNTKSTNRLDKNAFRIKNKLFCGKQSAKWCLWHAKFGIATCWHQVEFECYQHCFNIASPALMLFGAMLYLTHGRDVYFYDPDVPPSSMLYTSTNHGFWRLALHALSMAHNVWHSNILTPGRIRLLSTLLQHCFTSVDVVWGYPISDTRSKCAVLRSRCSTFEHAVQKHQFHLILFFSNTHATTFSAYLSTQNTLNWITIWQQGCSHPSQVDEQAAWLRDATSVSRPSVK